MSRTGVGVMATVLALAFAAPVMAQSRTPLGAEMGANAAGTIPIVDALVGKDKMNWSNSQGQLKAWKNIWSAGQGVDHIRAVEATATIVDRYAAEYAEALRKPAFSSGSR